jgi:hypothetical protein
MGKQAVRAIEASCIALVVSCGGGGNAALSRSFDYATPAPPTTNEEAVVSSAEGGLSQAATFASEPTTSKGVTVADLADDLAAVALGIVPIRSTVAPPGRGSPLHSAFSDTCVTVTATSVSFANCLDVDHSLTFTLNGTISATPGQIDWNLSNRVAGTESDGVSIDVTGHPSGSLAVTPTTIKGTALSDLGGSVTGPGQSGFAVASAELIDVAYQAQPAFCITSGTIEVKRVWTKRPNGASGGVFADAGVKLAWIGCGAVQIAHSR